MSPCDDGVSARPLGPQEALFTELTRRCNGGIQLVTLARFETPRNPRDVCRALEAIHRRHPLLRARVEQREALRWVCDVPFERVGLRAEPAGDPFDLEAFYAAEAARVLDVASCSWRAVLLTDARGDVTWIALVANHAAVDGRSALVILNDLDIQLNERELWSDEPLPLTQSAEAGLVAAGRSGDRAFLPAWPERTMWPVERPAASVERKPYGFLRVVPQRTIAAVDERLRAENIKLASAFAAAGVQAAQELPGRTEWTGILAPTDVRADCKPSISDNAVGGYIAGINLLIGPEHQDAGPLDVARELQRQFLSNRPPSLLMDAEVPLADTLQQVERMARANDVFRGGLCVTDVGDLNRLSGRRVGLSEVMMMPSQNHGIHSILVCIVSTAAGTCLSFGFDDPLRGRAHAHAFADRFTEALTALA